MNKTTKLLAEDIPGHYLNRHPESTQTYRHGKVSLARPARLSDGKTYPVTTRRIGS